MANTADHQPLIVTAEERPKPAMQKLARALITLVRLRHSQPRPADADTRHTTNEPDGVQEVRHA